MAKKRTRRSGPTTKNDHRETDTEKTQVSPSGDLGPTEIKSPKKTKTSKPAPSHEPEKSLSSDAEALADDTRVPLRKGANITDGYEVLELTGRDATSLHYAVTDTHLDTRLSIKEFYPLTGVTREDSGKLAIDAPTEPSDKTGARAQNSLLDAFLRDARALGRLHHPHIVRVHRIFKHNNTTYSVLDNERGKSLEAVTQDRDNPLPANDFAALAGPLLSAFAALHEEGVTHGSLQPKDIVIRDSGAPVLMNCGTARDAFVTDDTTNNGSGPHDTPPGPWTDIYLLAEIFYRLISGEPPPTFTARAGGAHLMPLAEQKFSGYDSKMLAAVDAGLKQSARDRPASIPEWSHRLLPKQISSDAAVPTPPSPQAATRKRAVAPNKNPQTHIAAVPQASTTSTTGGGLRPNLETVLTTATRVIASIPDIEDKSGGTPLPYERVFLVAAIVGGLIGSVLFVTGVSFPLAAVFQVMATLLFFFRGLLPARRYLHNAIPSVDTTKSRCSAVTKTTAFMIVAILLLMTVNPFFVERHVGRTGEFPLFYLGIIITFLAVGYAGFALIGTDLKRPVLSFLFGCANWLVLGFCLMVFVGIYLAEPPQPIPQPILVNRYFYLFAAASCCCLCFYVYLCRVAAKQRVRQALVMS